MRLVIRPIAPTARSVERSEEHTSELQSLRHLVCRLLLEKKEHTSELQSLRHLVCRLLLEKKNHKPKDRPQLQHTRRKERAHINAMHHVQRRHTLQHEPNT